MMNNRTIQKFGYARVSSKDQNLARQITALTEVGIEKDFIYTDKWSGKNFDRPSYKRLMDDMHEMDELYIKSIDRLGRNYDEILEQWRYVTKVKKVNIIVLDFPLLDTRHSSGGVTGEFIADLVLQILSYVAQVKRENIHQRQMEGIREARRRGVQLGRPRIPIPDEFHAVSDMVRKNKMSLREGAKVLGVSHTTLKKWIKEQQSAEKQRII